MSYTVNANGNLVARGPDTFGYDQANGLKTATIGSTTSTYSYDGDGKRVSVTVGTNPTVTYRYDVNRGLPVVLEDGTRKYVCGHGLAYAATPRGRSQRTMVDYNSLLDPETARGLWAGLRDRRHLPPGARLSWPTEAWQRQLAEALLRLPDEVDPVRWPQEEWSMEVARYAVWMALRQLEREYRGRSLRRDLPPAFQELVDDRDQAWLPGASKEDPFAALAEAPEASPDTLRSVLRGVPQGAAPLCWAAGPHARWRVG